MPKKRKPSERKKVRKMKVSEVTTQDITDYLRLDDANDIEIKEIDRMYVSAVAYITAFTGLKEEELDEHEDITQALFLLIADMFDNRNLYTENKASNENMAVKDILRMHSVNLL